MEYARDMKTIRVDYEHKIETTKVRRMELLIVRYSLGLVAIVEWESARWYSATARKRTQERNRTIARESSQVRRRCHTGAVLPGESLSRTQREGLICDWSSNLIFLCSRLVWSKNWNRSEYRSGLVSETFDSFRISKLQLDTTNEKNQIIRKEKDYQVLRSSSSASITVDALLRILFTRCTTTSSIVPNVCRTTPMNRSSSIPRRVLETTSKHGWAKSR